LYGSKRNSSSGIGMAHFFCSDQWIDILVKSFKLLGFKGCGKTKMREK
jgi:hypothetical protein